MGLETLWLFVASLGLHLNILIPYLVPTGGVGEVRGGDPGAEDGETGVPDPRALFILLQGGSVSQSVC